LDGFRWAEHDWRRVYNYHGIFSTSRFAEAMQRSTSHL
jgi:hypothetical protein